MATMQENIDRIEQAKLDIKQAIIDKGVAVSNEDKIDVYASKIDEIEVGDKINNEDKTVTVIENKPLNVTFNEGYTGLGNVSINPEVIYYVSPTYNCPWGPEEFIRRFKNYDWKCDEWNIGYVCDPDAGILVSGDPQYGEDYWQRGYYKDQIWDYLSTENNDSWKEPSLDEYGKNIVNYNKVTARKIDPEWSNYEPFVFFKGKPLDNSNIEVRQINYTDYYGEQQTVNVIYDDGQGNYNKFYDEYDSETSIDNPVTGISYNTPLMAVKSGGYGYYVDSNDGKEYYGIVLPPSNYSLVNRTYGLTFVPSSNYRYPNVSDFIIVQDGDNYYDLANLTFEMVSTEHPLEQNIRFMNRVVVWNNRFSNYKNLQYINHLIINNSCQLPSTIKGVGFIDVNSQPRNLFSGCVNITEVPWMNTTDRTDFSKMFYGCSSLSKIPDLDTSSATNIQGMFQQTAITEVPDIDTSNVTDMSYVLAGCSGITDTPNWDYSKVKNLQYAFYGTGVTDADLYLPEVTNLSWLFYSCYNLKTVNINAPKANGLQGTFMGCRNVESIGSMDASNYTFMSNVFGSYNLTKLTSLGGFLGLKVDWNDSGALNRCPNLTYESLMNVINGLYDFIGNGETGGKTIQFSTNSQSLLSDADIEVATNKGWIITFA